jgi:hypothetical protein
MDNSSQNLSLNSKVQKQSRWSLLLQYLLVPPVPLFDNKLSPFCLNLIKITYFTWSFNWYVAEWDVRKPHYRSHVGDPNVIIQWKWWLGYYESIKIKLLCLQKIITYIFHIIKYLWHWVTHMGAVVSFDDAVSIRYILWNKREDWFVDQMFPLCYFWQSMFTTRKWE